MHLHGLPGTAVPCDRNRLAGAGDPPGYLDISMLHELLHTLGLTASCAPHHTRAGHVSDSPNDLMWAGDDAVAAAAEARHRSRRLATAMLSSGCADLARSPYLTSNPLLRLHRRHRRG
jgi:hypothetical protein